MKAVVLLSGGIDSATTLYYAKEKGYNIYCLGFDYGQRHKKETTFGKKLAGLSDSEYKLLKINFPWKGSSLLDKSLKIPEAKRVRRGIPNTYVPGRNIIFLSYAVSYAEAIGADKIFIGANQIDYSGYPDCRSSFLKSFSDAINKGTRKGMQGKRIKIEAPLINRTKAEIIRMAFKFKIPLKYTWSCYKGGITPCGRCDSCIIRKEGFKKTGVKDPLIDG